VSLLPILTWPDERLCRPAAALPDGPADAAMRQLAQDMLETMYAAPGRGLAAPQVGRMVRLFVMDAGWKEGRPSPRVLVNPVLTWASETVATGPEGCLSIPGLSVEVTRAAAIRVAWNDLEGGVQEADFTGFEAICAQHEIDHLDGRVTLDRVGADRRASLLALYAAGRGA
jgi:peptide deformylase